MLLRRSLCVLVTAACATASTVSAASAAPALANRTFHLGSVYVITGHTGTWALSKQHMLGTVALSGHWNGRPWQMIARVQAKRPDGFYRFVVRPKRRGVLHLRIGTPDAAVYRVTLTVI